MLLRELHKQEIISSYAGNYARNFYALIDSRNYRSARGLYTISRNQALKIIASIDYFRVVTKHRFSSLRIGIAISSFHGRSTKERERERERERGGGGGVGREGEQGEKRRPRDARNASYLAAVSKIPLFSLHV
jgi:hypothetical protein